MPGKIPILLIITLILIAGCSTTVQKDQPAAAPATGSVEVSSSPAGAEVYLDNVYKGTTPVTITDLPPGTYTLELRLRDYQPLSKSIVIGKGGKVYADTALAPVPVVTTLPAPVPTTILVIVPTTRPRPSTKETTEPTTSATPQPSVSLAGIHRGYWKQRAESTEEYPFTITLTQDGKGLWGTIVQHKQSPLLNFNNDSVSGTVVGTTVILVANTPGDVIFNGIYDPVSRQIAGRWYAGISEGPFAITITPLVY